MGPASQCLESRQTAACALDLGLIDQMHFVIRQRVHEFPRTQFDPRRSRQLAAVRHSAAPLTSPGRGDPSGWQQHISECGDRERLRQRADEVEPMFTADRAAASKTRPRCRW